MHTSRRDSLAALHERRLAKHAEVIAGFGSTDPRIPLITLARAVDCTALGSWTLEDTLRSSGRVPQVAEGWRLAAGWLLDATRSKWQEAGTPLIPSDADRESWAASYLDFCTTLHRNERALMTLGLEERRDGVGTDSADIPIDAEMLFEHFAYIDDLKEIRRSIRATQRRALQALRDERPRVLSSMRRRCRPWNEYFPSYSTSPQIDEWYFRLGDLVAARMTEVALLPRAARFGGVQVETIAAIIADEIAFVLKHLDYCVLLRERFPRLRWHDLVTITQDRAAVADVIAQRYDLDRDASEGILDLLSWSEEAPASIAPNLVSEHRDIDVPALPLFIRTSQNQHIRLVAGVLGDPGRFLMRALRSRFPKDWENSRSARLEALSSLLASMLPRFTRVSGGSDVTGRFPTLVEGHVEIRSLTDLSPPPGLASQRRVLWVTSHDEATTRRPHGVDETAVLSGFSWFARSLLVRDARNVTGDLLWREATGLRAQLRPEGVPLVITVSDEAESVRLWSRSIAATDGPTEASDALAAFRAAIDREDRSLLASARGIDGRYATSMLMSAADRQMSFATVLRNDMTTTTESVQGPTPKSAREDANSPGMMDRYDDRGRALSLRFAYGYARSLGTFVTTPSENTWPPTEPPPVHSDSWADAAILRAAEIASLEQALHLVRTGLATAHRRGPTEWSVIIAHTAAIVEARERDYIRKVTERIRDSSEAMRARLEISQPGVLRRLSKRVHLRNGRELIIDLTSSMRRHFSEAAMYAIRQMLGADSFDADAEFGGVPFGAYRWTAVLLAAEALSRVAAAESLSKRELLFDPRSVKTTGWRVAGLARRVSEMAEIDEASAARAIAAFTLDASGATAYRRTPRAPWPPLVRTAPDHVLMSVAGCLDEPFQFLLMRLRDLYPSDWDRAVDGREAIFRRDLYASIAGGLSSRFVTTSGSIRIRAAGQQLTDVDAVIYDRLTGDLALVQLKWQDAFGASLTRRASTAKNFTSAATQWVETVARWLEGRSADDLRAHFQLPAGARGIRPRLFVLGRFAAHFSGYAPPDARAAWGTWSQVLNLVAGTHESAAEAEDAHAAPLAWLDARLRRDSPHEQRGEAIAGEEEILVGGLRVVVQYEQAGEGATVGAG